MKATQKETILMQLAMAILTLALLMTACAPPEPMETPVIPATATATETAVPSATHTLVPTATDTPEPTPTETATPTATHTVIPTLPEDLGSLYEDMAFVHAGVFPMGCDPEHNGGSSCVKEELPLHTVFVDSFFIDIYEVTNIKYAGCVAAGACENPKDFSSETRDYYYGNPTYFHYPVIYVDYDMAAAYCAWKGKSLPTEAQWEKAARGSISRAYPWGDENPNCELANSFDNAISAYCVGDTSPVGAYPLGASEFGVYDMTGNVYEWVADWYDAEYYSVSPFEDPTGPESGIYRVLRGGGFGDNWFFSRVAYRSKGTDFPSYYGNNIGFRCAAPMP